MTDATTALQSSLPEKGSRRHPLREIFSKNHWPIVTTQGLTVSEEVLKLLHPAAIGWAVNDLLQGRYVGLGVFAGLYMTQIGARARVYDLLRARCSECHRRAVRILRGAGHAVRL